MSGDKKSRNLKELYKLALSEEDDDFSPIYNQLKSLEQRYSQSQLIAKGGSKNIYSVFDRVTERNVALAKLKEDASRQQYDSFIREARLTGLLAHPNIMTVHDIGLQEDGQPYFTMELKNGGSFEALVREAVKLDELLDVFLKVCDAVAFAHSKKVLHLDLKPENIQVGDFGEVLVCDWGLGKIVQEPDDAEIDALLFNPDLLNDMTLNGYIKGTPGYMAPEQAEVNLDKTFQTDIYALGGLLYYLLTGLCPLEGNADEKLKLTIKGEVIEPVKRCPDKEIPVALNAVVKKAMSVSPDERYESVNDLKTEVLKYIGGFATKAEDAGFLKQLSLFWKRNNLICSISFLFIIVLFTSLSVFVFELQKSRDLAEAQREAALKNQQKSDETLRLYLKEKRELDSAQRKWSADITKQMDPLRYHFYYENPERYVKQTIEGLKRALKIDKENERALGLMGHQYFMTQRFNKANEIFEKGNYRQSDILPISKDFAQFKMDRELLTISQLAELIKRLGSGEKVRSQLSERIIAWDVATRKEKNDYSLPVHELLVVNNLGRRDFIFSYDQSKDSLLLEGYSSSLAQDNSIGSGKCILRFMDVKKLTLKDCNNFKMKELSSLISLSTLDISESSIKSLKSDEVLNQLKCLVISENQYKRFKKDLEGLEGELKIK